MKRLFFLFLALLTWRDSSGLAVWNQKPAQYWQGVGLTSLGQHFPYSVSSNVVQTAASVPVQSTSGSYSQSADSATTVNPSSCGSTSLTPQAPKSQYAEFVTGQLYRPVSQAWTGVQSVPFQQGGIGLSSGALNPYTAQTSGFQHFSSSSQTTSTSGLQDQVSQSPALSQGDATVSGAVSQQGSFAPSATGSSWFTSGQGVQSSQSPPEAQSQTLNPVPQVVLSSGFQSLLSQTSPQGVASVSVPQQQGHDQSAASWITSRVQGVPSSPGQISAVQAHLTKPALASGRPANLYTTVRGTYGPQSPESSSWNAQPQRPSSISTQFQPSFMRSPGMKPYGSFAYASYPYAYMRLGSGGLGSAFSMYGSENS